MQKKQVDPDKVFRIQNQVLRAAMNCPKPVRTPADCFLCKNEECKAAWAALQELWPEKVDIKAVTFSKRSEFKRIEANSKPKPKPEGLFRGGRK